MRQERIPRKPASDDSGFSQAYFVYVKEKLEIGARFFRKMPQAYCAVLLKARAARGWMAFEKARHTDPPPRRERARARFKNSRGKRPLPC